MTELIAAAATNGMMAAVTCLAFAGTIAASILALGVVVGLGKQIISIVKSWF